MSKSKRKNAAGRADDAAQGPADAAASAAPSPEERVEPADLNGGGMSRDEAAQAVGVAADEVLAFRDHVTHVVVVTIDGRKLSNAEAAE